ncbi:phospho-sugar mutase [Ruminococcaceae bacterium OttesenSCG-928-L11]|nr:phospho-sugar mutase [Ruminococcaceae bacterium OttesenSCG-928-L11]
MIPIEIWERWKQHAGESSELLQELAAMQVSEIEAAFGEPLLFGTGGLRGILGAGTARMNIFTVRKASQGLAGYLLNNCKRKPSVAIAYDSRINSECFAREAACVFAANGITTHLYPLLMPTPALSFAVRRLGCDAGICITASHNPAKYNGYKVYGSDGCQITPEAACAVQERIDHIDCFDDVITMAFEKAAEMGDIKWISDTITEEYLAAVRALRVEPDIDIPLHVVYTPLNGAGLTCVQRVLLESGVRLDIVPEQGFPDGNFPTCPYPNPEETEALEVGLALSRKLQPDLLLATDPDCDRVGVAVRCAGEYRPLSGNEVGILLLDYICRSKCTANSLPKAAAVVKTIVTTDMAFPIARKYGVTVHQVLTGFKYIGEQIGLLEKQGKEDAYIFGFEESCGYLSGTHVRDKDAVNAALLICDMARHYKKDGKNLCDMLEELCVEYGYYRNALDSISLDFPEGKARMEKAISMLRKSPPSVIGKFGVLKVVDYEKGMPATPENPCCLPPSNVLELQLEGDAKLIVRPSGTEPKVKLYSFVRETNAETAEQKLMELRTSGVELLGRT